MLCVTGHQTTPFCPNINFIFLQYVLISKNTKLDFLLSYQQRNILLNRVPKRPIYFGCIEGIIFNKLFLRTILLVFSEFYFWKVLVDPLKSSLYFQEPYFHVSKEDVCMCICYLLKMLKTSLLNKCCCVRGGSRKI